MVRPGYSRSGMRGGPGEKHACVAEFKTTGLTARTPSEKKVVVLGKCSDGNPRRGMDSWARRFDKKHIWANRRGRVRGDKTIELWPI